MGIENFEFGFFFNMKFLIRKLEFENGNLELGIGKLEFGIGNWELGIWDLEFGICFLIRNLKLRIGNLVFNLEFGI